MGNFINTAIVRMNSFLFILMGRSIRTNPSLLPLFSYAEVMEAFATQDPEAYKHEAVENFLMPWDRYPSAYPTGEVYPVSDQVLALRIKVQTAQQFGMITLPSTNGLIIASGVPIRSVVGALDHHGRILDVLTLPTLEWKLADAPREQFPCSRGICYLPSLEVFHAYRVATEDTDGAQILLNLPAYEPSKQKDLRAPRAPVAKPPIGANRFPGWETMARPAPL